MSYRKNKTTKWFVYAPGTGRRQLAYTPKTWEAWLITLCYFASLILVPLLVYSLYPISSSIGIVVGLLLIIILLTSLYLYMCKKKS